MKRLFLLIVMLLMTSTLIACGSSYMGKIVKKDMTRAIQTSGGKKHHYVLDQLIVDYSYTIDPGQQLITIKGTIDDRQQDPQAHFVQDSGWTLEEAYLDIFFLSADRRVLDSCRKPFPLGHFAFPYPFEVTCAYNPLYKNAAVAYKYKYVTYPRGGKVEKVYQHRLDIQQ